MATSARTPPMLFFLTTLVAAALSPERAGALLGPCVEFRFDVEVLGPPAGSDSTSGCAPGGPDQAFVQFGPGDPFFGSDPVLFARAAGNNAAVFNDITVGVETDTIHHTYPPLMSAGGVAAHVEDGGRWW